MDMFTALDPRWGWLALGMVLAIAEIAIPGVFLIWLAGAALVTGLLTFVLPIGLPLQIGVFAVLAIGSVFAGRRWLAAHPVVGADPLMNDRTGRLIGQTVLVTNAIVGGAGKVRQGDGEWLARGPDAEPGTRMRVSGAEGTVLLVEHMH